MVEVPIDQLCREIGLGETVHRVHQEPRDGAVGPSHNYLVTSLELSEPVEDRGSVRRRIDMAKDDRRSDGTGCGRMLVPSGFVVTVPSRRLDRPVVLESDGMKRGTNADRADLYSYGNGRRHRC